MDITVLIVGAGPVGMTIALCLSRRGIPFRIVDKLQERSPLSKALAIWPRTLEVLDIEGVTQDFVKAGHKVYGAHIWADRESLMSLDFRDAETGHQYGLMLPQYETERLLEEHLRLAGVDVERGLELLDFRQNGDCVAVNLRSAGGGVQGCSAHWLIACDGAHSTVRHQLPEAKFEGDTLPSSWALADVTLETELPESEISTFWDRDRLLLAVPFGAKRFRIIANVGEGNQAHLPTLSLADIQHILDSRCGVKALATDPQWINRIVINERKLADYRFGRIFLAGDAAHVHSPAGGQGMNTGMQDAANLAWKLAMVIRGEAKPELLDSYSTERSAIGKQVLRNAGRLTRVAIVANPVLQQARTLAMHALGHYDSARHKIAEQFMELGLHYRHNLITHELPGQAACIEPGARVPNVGLSASPAGRLTLYSLLSYGRFVILSVGTERFQVPERLRRIAISAQVDQAEGYEHGFVYVVRPDAYLSFSVPGDDTLAVNTILGAIACE